MVLNHVNAENEMKVYTKRVFRNSNFQQIFLNWYTCISIINGANLVNFGRLVVGGHLEGTMSQIFCLGLSFHYMKFRKFSCRKCQNVSRFLT